MVFGIVFVLGVFAIALLLAAQQKKIIMFIQKVLKVQGAYCKYKCFNLNLNYLVL